MGIIKASKLIYDYIRRDEDDHVEEVKRAIDDLTLDINQGDFVAILGHNGSGKSTFAKQVNGILLPTDGTVWISGMNTADDAHIWDIRKTAGMVFQNPDNQIIGNIVEEDVGFGPENLGVPTDEIWRRVDQSLEAVGMTVPFEIAKQTVRRSEAACGNCRCHGYASAVHHPGRTDCHAGSEWPQGSHCDPS